MINNSMINFELGSIPIGICNFRWEIAIIEQSNNIKSIDLLTGTSKNLLTISQYETLDAITTIDERTMIIAKHLDFPTRSSTLIKY